MLLNLKTISLPIIFIYFLSIVIDPQGGLYRFNDIATILAFSYLLFSLLILKKIDINRNQLLLVLWFCLFLPIYGIMIAIARKVGFNDFIDTSYIGAAVFFLISFIFTKDNLDNTIKIFILILRILSLIIISVLFFSLTNNTFNIIWFFVAHDSAFFGLRNIGPIEAYYIYFVASPLILCLYFYDYLNFLRNFHFRNFLKFILSFSAIILSANRMNLILIFFSMIIIPFILIKDFQLRIIYFLFLLIASILIALFYTDALIVFFDSVFGSDARFSYFDKYLMIFNEPTNFLIGQGFNAHFWSSDFLSLVNPSHNIVHASKVELTYFEFLRVFGIFNFIIFIFFIYYILSELFKLEDYLWLCLGILFYLIGSFSNPNLFSVIGMLPIGLAFAVIRLKSGQRNIQHNE